MTENKTENKTVIFVILIIVFIGIFPLYGFLINKCFSTWENSGIFGDSFGAINSFFTGGAFLLAIYALILQNKEIKQNEKDQEKINKKTENNIEIMETLSMLNTLVIISSERAKAHAISVSQTNPNDPHLEELKKLNLKLDKYLKHAENLYEKITKKESQDK